MTRRLPGHEPYLEAFERWRADHPAPGWWETLREEALGHFADTGIPSTRSEEWRYTNLAALAKEPFALPAPVDAERRAIERGALESLCSPVFACHLFVFVDGRYAPELSTPESLGSEVRVHSLFAERGGHGDGELLRGRLGELVDTKRHPFAALNTAFLDDGALLDVPAGRVVDNPVHVVFVSSGTREPTVVHPRLHVRVARGAEVTVVQDHVSLGAGTRFTNAVTEIAVEEGASAHAVVLQRESDDTFHLSHLSARVERDARLSTHTISLGGRLVRNDLACLLAGEGSEVRLDGLFVGSDDQVLDNHTWVDHAVPHGTSDEHYKGVLAGRSRGVFRGRVRVRPGAQKTAATQSNPNLLLTTGAEVDSKPQLEIHADDVRCSHGSTIGQLDPEALFYLRARGLSMRRARDLLTRGFAAEICDALPQPALGELVGELLIEKLHRAEEAR